ncbi:MAG: hypothetical protein ACT4PT_06220 [Methanobacteriota archaeon]
MTRPGSESADVQGAAFWREFDGIPLCHTPATDAERRALAAKGACGPGCDWRSRSTDERGF